MISADISNIRPRIMRKLSDYLALTKFRVMTLLLFTGAAGTLLAAQGAPSLGALLSVLVGGALASGGAASLNMYLERDLDKKMGRTKNRPIVEGRITPRNALMFGIVLNVLAFAFIWFQSNVLAASLAILGTVLYLGLYTIILKPSTPQNIVIGGAAGAIPPLVGYAAEAGTIDLAAWYMFAIVFFWTPPHFWALALMIKEDYARAEVPMLPNVHGEGAARVQILLYSLLLSAITLAFPAVARQLGPFYLGVAGTLGFAFIWFAWLLTRQRTKDAAWKLYRFSLLYLFLLFGAVMVDAALI